MNELRQAMIEQMLLKGFSERTKKSYLDAVSLLARHYHLAPDKLSQADIQNWLLYLIKDRHLSPATCHLYFNAVRFFYLQVLHWSTLQLELIVPKRQQRIPDLLSPHEVGLIIEKAHPAKYRTMFAVCYACGLRVSELVALQVCHIHSEQMYMQVVQGKGFKDRNIPLADSVLQLLRDHWRAVHPISYLFTGYNPYVPISITSVQKVFTKTKALAELTKVGGIHSLRHAFASHHLAAGMPIHQLKDLLGHTDLKSTERYLHWCPQTNTVNHDLLAKVQGGKSHE